MRNTFLNILLIVLLIACKNNPNKTVSKVVTPKEETTVIIQQQSKDTVKEKTAIGKTFGNRLSELKEFKMYGDHGGHSITNSEQNEKYINYGIRTLDDPKSHKEKMIVMLNNDLIIDYLEIDYSNVPKGSQYYIDGIKYKGEIDKELVVFAKSWDEDEDEEEIITEVYKVYRADKETGKIFEIPTDGVTIVADYSGP